MDAKPKAAIETPLRKREEALGASFATWFGCILPQQFSTLENEYRFARETSALVNKNYRAFLYLTGPDRERYLNAILTNDVREAATGRGVPSLLLNPQGHVLAELEIYSLGDRHLVVSYQMIRERLIEALDRYIIMDDVAIEDATDTLAVLGVEGPKSADVLRAADGRELESFAELELRDANIGGIPVRVVRRSPGGVPGFECIVERAGVESLWDALLEAVLAAGGGPIGYDALNTLRLEAGLPWFGYDFDENVIPHEARLETSHISFSKGCYTGQEIVERVRSRGHVNRMRVGLEFSGGSIPERGAKLAADGKEVGHVTRAGFSPALGRGIGMGYLRREHA
ncbi:MAG: aminomethyltransferase family protein, partial [Candidatus Acidiferrales bacterium]